ncbi:MAG: hypothetical protein ACJA0U_003255 [Salibacteraceae bacterium]|jgi:hypothetical protein
MTSAYGQLSVSLGATRKSERLITENHFKVKPYNDMGFNSANRAYVNTYISGAARYRFNRFVIDAELSYLRKKELNFYAERHSSQIVYQPSPFPSYTEYKEIYSEASVDFSFIGLKLGSSVLVESKSFLFKKMPRNETTFGLIFQGEFTLQEIEDHHEVNSATTNFLSSSGGGPPPTYFQTFDEEFDMVKTPAVVMSSGVRIDHSIVFNNFFCGLNVAVGFMLNNRYELLQGERYPEFTTPLKNHFFETGIFIGRKFKNKKE